MSDLLHVAIEGGLGIVTVNRPKVLNALNRALLEELRTVLRGLAVTESVHAVILTGAGEKAFVAGADIQEMLELTPMQMKEFSRLGQEVAHLLQSMPKPTIAAINGYALGGGCELALACDIRLASEEAQLGLPEVSLGIFPGFGGTQRLPRLVGHGKAAELIFTGERIDAAEALRIGLVNHVVPAPRLLDEARKLAGHILARAPVAVRHAKEALNRAAEAPLQEGLQYERESFALTAATKDREAGMRAFVEKRKPEFTGK
jgi:enoyl-CoA hydratase